MELRVPLLNIDIQQIAHSLMHVEILASKGVVTDKRVIDFINPRYKVTDCQRWIAGGLGKMVESCIQVSFNARGSAFALIMVTISNMAQHFDKFGAELLDPEFVGPSGQRLTVHDLFMCTNQVSVQDVIWSMLLQLPSQVTLTHKVNENGT